MQNIEVLAAFSVLAVAKLKADACAAFATFQLPRAALARRFGADITGTSC